MKLKLYDVDYNDELIFEDGYVISVECKEKSYFNQLIAGLKGLNDNRIAVFEGDERIDFQKDSIVVIDYFGLSQYEKAVITKLYKQIEKTCGNSPQVIDSLQNVYSALTKITEEISDVYDFTFDMDVPTGISEYLKLISLKPQNGFDYGISGICNFISLVATLNLYKLTVFVNAKSFYSLDEINEIIKACVYSGQHVLFIDNSEFEYKNPNEIKLVIDEDYYDVLYK